jgi:hypothetical protein
MKVLQPGLTLTVTLAYPDYAGEALVNFLALGVLSSSSLTDEFRWAEPTPGNDLEPEGNNNVQRLVWGNIPVGTCSIEIDCRRVSMPNVAARQHYAVCWDFRTP